MIDITNFNNYNYMSTKFGFCVKNVCRSVDLGRNRAFFSPDVEARVPTEGSNKNEGRWKRNVGSSTLLLWRKRAARTNRPIL